MAISDPICTEVPRTRRDKFHWSEERLTEARSLIGAAAKTVVPTVTLHIVKRDPDADRVLECGITANAGLIVTGDSDLRDLGEYQGIEIIPVAELLNRVRDPDQA